MNMSCKGSKITDSALTL